MFNDHFSSIGTKVADSLPTPYGGASFRDYLGPMASNNLWIDAIFPPQITETILKIAKKGSRDVKDVSFQLIHKVAHQVSLPLSHIFNLSISNGIFPDSFKISKVVPIFKAGSPQDPGNYRGIALVDAFSKVFEKLVADRLVKFLVNEKFYYAHQYGSIKGRSTGQAVLQVCNYVSRAINESWLSFWTYKKLSTRLTRSCLDLNLDALPGFAWDSDGA